MRGREGGREGYTEFNGVCAMLVYNSGYLWSKRVYRVILSIAAAIARYILLAKVYAELYSVSLGTYQDGYN